MKVVIITKASKGFTKIGHIVGYTTKSETKVAVIKLIYPLKEGTKYAYISEGGYVRLCLQ